MDHPSLVTRFRLYLRQFNPIEFTENQEAIATRIEEILSPKVAVDARHVPLAGD